MSDEPTQKPEDRDFKLELRKLALDRQRFKLERERAARESKFVNRHFAALLAAAVAFTGVCSSVASVWAAYASKRNELDIATRANLVKFVADNRTVIFGNDRLAGEQIRDVMKTCFPQDLLVPVLRRIEVAVPPQTRDIFSVGTLISVVARGKIQTFGGPNDSGCSPSEDPALVNNLAEMQALKEYFLPEQPPGTTGLVRRLDPKTYYIACRWNYADTSKAFLRQTLVKVKNVKTGKVLDAKPVDWGPNSVTGRIADLSPGLAADLGVKTDEEVEVIIVK